MVYIFIKNLYVGIAERLIDLVKKYNPDVVIDSSDKAEEMMKEQYCLVNSFYISHLLGKCKFCGGNYVITKPTIERK